MKEEFDDSRTERSPDEPLPGFGEVENERLSKSLIEGGAHINEMEVGKFLEVETENTIYTIEKRPDGYYISGHPKYCLKPVKVEIRGSTFGGSMIKLNFIGRGMHLEFIHPERGKIITSEIKEIKEFDKPASGT